MRNTPLKAFTKKGNSALKQRNTFVSDSDTAIPYETNPPIIEEKKTGPYDKFASLPPVKEVDSGEITNTKEERMIKAHREANPLYNAVKGVKNVYDAFKG